MLAAPANIKDNIKNLLFIVFLVFCCSTLFLFLPSLFPVDRVISGKT